MNLILIEKINVQTVHASPKFSFGDTSEYNRFRLLRTINAPIQVEKPAYCTMLINRRNKGVRNLFRLLPYQLHLVHKILIQNQRLVKHIPRVYAKIFHYFPSPVPTVWHSPSFLARYPRLFFKKKKSLSLPVVSAVELHALSRDPTP